MRYKLDVDGYVSAVAFGCYLDSCTNYTGEIPKGYDSLEDWATNSNINAYYIEEGNLVLDEERLAYLNDKIALETIDNTPVLRKDIYGSEEVLNSQYKKAIKTGEIITLTDVPRIAPKVKITGIKPYEYEHLKIFTQGENIMPFGAKTESISGVSFTVSGNTISMIGLATEDIYYTISGSDTNTTPLFAFKYETGYNINKPSFATCQFIYNDGEHYYVKEETTHDSFQTIDAKITQVILKIPKDTPISESYSFTPTLAIESTTNAEYKGKVLDIDFSKYVKHKEIYPNKTLYPSENLYPKELIDFKETVIDYILIENGIIYASVDGIQQVIGSGNVALFSDYNNIYASEGVELEIEYCKNVNDITVEDLDFLRGKETTTGKFRVDKETGSIYAKDGYFEGEVQATSGKFKGRVEADEGYFKGRIEAEEGTFKGSITSDDAIITGGKLEIQADDYSTDIIKILTKDGDGILSVGVSSADIKIKGVATGSSISSSGVNIGYLDEEYGYVTSPTTILGIGRCQFPYTIITSNCDVKGTLYTADGTVSKSDRNVKKDISELDAEKSSQFIYSLKPSQYKYIDGTSDRYHHGFIAQEIKESMGADDWGVYVDRSLDANSESDTLALRYEELIADLVATVQTQNERIKQLEERIGETNE